MSTLCNKADFQDISHWPLSWRLEGWGAPVPPHHLAQMRALSGVDAARVWKLILDLGGIPFVSDTKPRQKLDDVVHTLDESGIAYECGGHTDRVLESDYIILSPGVPSTVDMLTILKSLLNSLARVKRILPEGNPDCPSGTPDKAYWPKNLRSSSR